MQSWDGQHVTTVTFWDNVCASGSHDSFYLSPCLALLRGNGGLPYGSIPPKGIALRRESSRRLESVSARSNPADDYDDDEGDLGATDSGDPQGRHNLRSHFLQPFSRWGGRYLALQTALHHA